MKSEVKVEELKKLIQSTRSMTYLQIVGLQIFIVAFLLSIENIMYILLLLIGAAALTKGFDKSILQNILKQIIEKRTIFVSLKTNIIFFTAEFLTTFTKFSPVFLKYTHLRD